jgi:hypothetical protein
MAFWIIFLFLFYKEIIFMVSNKVTVSLLVVLIYRPAQNDHGVFTGLVWNYISEQSKYGPTVLVVYFHNSELNFSLYCTIFNPVSAFKN